MDVVCDTSPLLAVLLGEPERPQILHLTQSRVAVAPASVPFEIANALSAMMRRDRLTVQGSAQIWRAWQTMQVQLRDFDLAMAVALSGSLKIYAYDAFVLQCARETRLPLLTLDKRMQSEAKKLGIRLLE